MAEGRLSKAYAVSWGGDNQPYYTQHGHEYEEVCGGGGVKTQ